MADHLSRRGLLTVAAGLFGGHRRAWATAPRPSVGAIRWDAWYAPGSDPTEAVTRALTPERYRFRLPFFARIDEAGVRLQGASQAVMDHEITLASEAGLDYWAFVAYRPGSSMTVAFDLYQSSARRHRLRFCMFSEALRWGDGDGLSNLAQYHLTLLQEPHYMRVAGGRPLYFLGFLDDRQLATRWQGGEALVAAVREFRRRATIGGAGNPYMVLSAPPARAAVWARQFGFDAIGAYAVAGQDVAAPYAHLAEMTERRWDELAVSGLPVLPTVMSGWDRRPRIEAPVPWERWQQPGVGLERYYETATPTELAQHLKRALQWLATHQESGPDSVLIYAWNENDEGGWLVPTYPFEDTRLRAIAEVLR